MDEQQTQACFEQTFQQVSADFAAEKADPRPRASAFYRELKHDPDASWTVRLRAQVRLDESWETVDLAQEPWAATQPLVTEAYAFYELVLAAADATRNVRIRARGRLDLLMNGRPQRSRRASSSAANSNRSAKVQLLDAWRRELEGDGDSSTGTPAPNISQSGGQPAHDSSADQRDEHPTPNDATSQSTADSLPDPSVISPALDTTIRQAIANAPPDADPFDIALNLYLDDKFPTSTSSPTTEDASPAAPSTSDAAGQSSSSPTARAPPPTDSVA